MEDFCQYLLKVSFVLSLFYISYHLLLRKETFFRFNRFFLLTGLLAAATLPLFYITTIIEASFTEVQQNNPVTISDTEDLSTALLTPYNLIIIPYAIVTMLFVSRLIIQVLQLKKIIKEGLSSKIGTKIHVRTTKNIAPFSFFTHIVYNPYKHSKNELTAILAHEDVHAKQFHSLDILLVELFLALHWFNPIVWLYRSAIKQNLEFLADTENHHIKTNRKAYQYALLQQTLGNQYLSIVNPFINSLIKKRIVMINQQQSNKLKALKSLIIIPLLGLFLVSFNTKKVYTSSNSLGSKVLLHAIEVIIDKDTTDEQLLRIKKDLGKEGFDFSYTTVRNAQGEIKSISLQVSGGNKKTGEVSSSFNSVADNDTISPTIISIDTNTNSISIVNSKVDHKTVNFKSTNEKKFKINTMPKSDHDIEMVEEDKNTFLFTDNSKKPLFYINGKKSSDNDLKLLDKTNIEFMHVLKGEVAIMKYGKDAANGVIEIITKE